jgi:hypothetical protein
MMDWLKKLFGAKQVKTERVSPDTTEYDDWKVEYGPWRKKTVCHCGHIKGSWPSEGGNVCPECGHEDKWDKRIVRDEYEYSHKKWADISLKYLTRIIARKYFLHGELEYYSELAIRQSRRNVKEVEWTEDHCKVNEDSSQ